MERKRFYYIIILVLILSNAFLINELVHQKSEGPRPGGRGKGSGIPGPRNLIIERLHFSDAQIEAYDELIVWHRANIEECDEEIITLKTALYSDLTVDSIKRDSLLKELNKIQLKVEKIHLQHFADIEKLCQAEQKKYFEELSVDLAKLFGKKKH
jgi:periplasmic protein CpxP/Spy